jgi:hypothetical protein
MAVNAVPPYALVMIALGASPSATLALQYNVTDRICISDSVMPPLEKKVPVPVGCKLVDCCPGCPGSGPLEWRIIVDAKVLQGAELRFDGMGVAELRKLKITGNARIEGDRILLRRGNSKIRGIPGKINGKVAVGSLLPMASKDAAAQVQSLPSGTSAPDLRSITEHITVQQYLGSFPVNDFRWRHIIKPCLASVNKPRVPWDTLKVGAHIPGDNVAVMIDARTAAGTTGCRDGSEGNEWVFSATPSSTGNIELPNLRSSAGCNSEVVVFSENHKMYFERNLSTWMDSPGDVHTATLEPLINVPVTVWVADSAAAARAVDEMNNANLLYRQNRAGIQFEPKYEQKWTDPTAVTTINNGIGTTPQGRTECVGLQDLKDKGLYTDRALNVYYVSREIYGRNCAITRTPTTPCPSAGAEKGDGNVTYIGSLINLVSVAHELGHAFGLRPGPCAGHTSERTATGEWVNLPGFGDDNIMGGAATDLADHFTLGQVFRMNTHQDEWGGTMLIENGLRPQADSRACMPNSAANKLCPVLKTDLP